MNGVLMEFIIDELIKAINDDIRIARERLQTPEAQTIKSNSFFNDSSKTN